MRTSSGLASQAWGHAAERRPGRGEHRPRPGTDHAPTAAATPRRRRTARTSRRRSTHSIRTHSPYRSPSKSNRCASRVRRPSVKGGLGALVHHPPGAPAAPLDPRPRRPRRAAAASAGGTSARLIVGTPSRRPRRSPWPTRPLTGTAGPASGRRWRDRRRPPPGGSASWRRAARRHPPRRPRPRRTRRSAPSRRRVSTSPLRPRPKP